MERAVDGDYQMYSVSSGPEVRAHWNGNDPRLADIMRHLSDEEIRGIKRGGHDQRKIFAAFERAVQSNGRPTAILIKTIKGYGMQGYEGSNVVHQKKNLSSRGTAGNRTAPRDSAVRRGQRPRRLLPAGGRQRGDPLPDGAPRGPRWRLAPP